jgi:hypothetical protein
MAVLASGGRDEYGAGRLGEAGGPDGRKAGSSVADVNALNLML